MCAAQLALLAVLVAAQSQSAAAGILQMHELDDACRRVIWLTGLQLSSASGQQAEYITTSDTYMDAYLVALRSAAANAPSLQPVLVVQGAIDPAFVADVRSLGGEVVAHELTFGGLLTQHQPGLASGLRGSYLRVDVGAVMPKVLAVLSAVGGGSSVGLASAIDTDYVLWTDPDVLYLGDVTSCSLPKPRFLSIGPDATHFNADNCGVVYYNVSGFAQARDALVEWSAMQAFQFKVADQDMMKKVGVGGRVRVRDRVYEGGAASTE